LKLKKIKKKYDVFIIIIPRNLKFKETKNTFVFAKEFKETKKSQKSD